MALKQFVCLLLAFTYISFTSGFQILDKSSSGCYGSNQTQPHILTCPPGGQIVVLRASVGSKPTSATRCTVLSDASVTECCQPEARDCLVESNSYLSQVRGQCEGEAACQVPRDPGDTGSACSSSGLYTNSAYTFIRYTCIPDGSVGLRSSSACFGSNLLAFHALVCPVGSTVGVLSVYFGTKLNSSCPLESWHETAQSCCQSQDGDCLLAARPGESKVRDLCSGRVHCVVQAERVTIGTRCPSSADHRWSTFQVVRYVCVQDNLINTVEWRDLFSRRQHTDIGTESTPPDTETTGRVVQSGLGFLTLHAGSTIDQSHITFIDGDPHTSDNQNPTHEDDTSTHGDSFPEFSNTDSQGPIYGLSKENIPPGTTHTYHTISYNPGQGNSNALSTKLILTTPQNTPVISRKGTFATPAYRFRTTDNPTTVSDDASKGGIKFPKPTYRTTTASYSLTDGSNARTSPNSTGGTKVISDFQMVPVAKENPNTKSPGSSITPMLEISEAKPSPRYLLNTAAEIPTRSLGHGLSSLPSVHTPTESVASRHLSSPEIQNTNIGEQPKQSEGELVRQASPSRSIDVEVITEQADELNSYTPNVYVSQTIKIANGEPASVVGLAPSPSFHPDISISGKRTDPPSKETPLPQILSTANSRLVLYSELGSLPMGKLESLVSDGPDIVQAPKDVLPSRSHYDARSYVYIQTSIQSSSAIGHHAIQPSLSTKIAVSLDGGIYDAHVQPSVNESFQSLRELYAGISSVHPGESNGQIQDSDISSKLEASPAVGHSGHQAQSSLNELFSLSKELHVGSESIHPRVTNPIRGYRVSTPDGLTASKITANPADGYFDGKIQTSDNELFSSSTENFTGVNPVHPRSSNPIRDPGVVSTPDGISSPLGPSSVTIDGIIPSKYVNLRIAQIENITSPVRSPAVHRYLHINEDNITTSSQSKEGESEFLIPMEPTESTLLDHALAMMYTNIPELNPSSSLFLDNKPPSSTQVSVLPQSPGTVSEVHMATPPLVLDAVLSESSSRSRETLVVRHPSAASTPATESEKPSADIGEPVQALNYSEFLTDQPRIKGTLRIAPLGLASSLLGRQTSIRFKLGANPSLVSSSNMYSSTHVNSYLVPLRLVAPELLPNRLTDKINPDKSILTQYDIYRSANQVASPVASSKGLEFSLQSTVVSRQLSKKSSMCTNTVCGSASNGVHDIQTVRAEEVFPSSQSDGANNSSANSFGTFASPILVQSQEIYHPIDMYASLRPSYPVNQAVSSRRSSAGSEQRDILTTSTASRGYVKPTTEQRSAALLRNPLQSQVSVLPTSIRSSIFELEPNSAVSTSSSSSVSKSSQSPPPVKSSVALAGILSPSLSESLLLSPSLVTNPAGAQQLTSSFGTALPSSAIQYFVSPTPSSKLMTLASEQNLAPDSAVSSLSLADPSPIPAEASQPITTPAGLQKSVSTISPEQGTNVGSKLAMGIGITIAILIFAILIFVVIVVIYNHCYPYSIGNEFALLDTLTTHGLFNSRRESNYREMSA